jgi:hypothetical protein
MNIKIIDVESTNVANPAALFKASAKSTQANPITKIFMFHPLFPIEAITNLTLLKAAQPQLCGKHKLPT